METLTTRYTTNTPASLQLRMPTGMWRIHKESWTERAREGISDRLSSPRYVKRAISVDILMDLNKHED